jgi:putative FmdB family regulatory protein
VPIYEYRCDNGHLTEVRQSFTDPSLETCNVCGAPVQKVLHSPAIHYKGSGFYSTDYGRGGKKKGPGDGKTDGSGDTSSSSDDSGTTSTTKGSDAAAPSSSTTGGSSGGSSSSSGSTPSSTD